MTLILDTYNVLHTTGVLPPHMAGLDIASLIALIGHSRYASDMAHLICDGTPKHDITPYDDTRFRLRYAGPGADADTLIIEMIAAAADPRRLTVISSDREIRAAARRRRCRTLTSEAFLQHLAHDADRNGPGKSAAPQKPPSPLTGDQVDRWISIFGLTEDDLSHEQGGRSTKPISHETDTPGDDDRDGAAARPDPPPRADPGPDRPKTLRSPTRDDRRHRARNKPADEGVVFPTDILREAEDMLDDESGDEASCREQA